MSAPRLKKLKGSNFGSFKGEFELELPATGLLLLTGKNLHTQGSSGSGKSTLIHALNYPLGTCDVPLTELQNWDTPDKVPVVSGTYEVAGKEVVVTRGKKFLIDENGEPFNGSAKQKDEELVRLFKMGPEMLHALTYRGQRQSGLFLSKANSEKNEFLTIILRLFRFEEEEKKCDAIVKALEEKIAVLRAREADLQQRKEELGPDIDRRAAESSVATIRAAISTEEEHIATFEKEMATMRHDADVLYQSIPEMFQPKVDEMEKKLADLRAVEPAFPPQSPEALKALEMHQEAKARHERLSKEDEVRRFHREQNIRDLNAVINRLAGQAGKVHGYLATRDRIEADLQVLEKNVCPTCSREWHENEQKKQDLHVELVNVNDEINQLGLVEAKIRELKEELAAMPAFEPNPKVELMANAIRHYANVCATEEQKRNAATYDKRIEHTKQVSEVTAALSKLRNDIAVAADTTRKKALSGVGGLQQLVFMSQDTVTKLRMSLEEATYHLGRVEERDKQLANIARDYTETMAKLNPLLKQLTKEKDFQHLVSREGFRGSIFDEVLAEISAETNEILAGIANTANCTLHFTSETVTGKGTVKREIAPVVTINGHPATLKFGPSGGMLSAIELAVDLAVGAVISRREGVTPGWLILDESFDGLGPVEKATCMEILQKYAAQRLVIVVDHSSETQGLFTQRINVEYLDGVSRIC